jgi:hypothetical protein
MLGGIGLTLFGMDLYLSSTQIQTLVHTTGIIQNSVTFLKNIANWRLLLDLSGIGLFGGFYIVPLYVLIQTRSDKKYQSRVIAANNIINALLMVASALYSIWIFNHHFNIPQLFLITALLNIVVMIYLCFRQPEYYKTFIIWIKKVIHYL